MTVTVVTESVGQRTPLRCTCCGQKILAEVTAGHLVIRAKRDRQWHVLVLSPAELRALLTAAESQP